MLIRKLTSKQPDNKMNVKVNILSYFLSSREYRFLPLLILYVVIIVLFSNDELIGDEKRYVAYAENLLDGFYSEQDDPYLRNGPGYPFFLVPFFLLKLPSIIPTIANAFLLFFSVILFYRILLRYVGEKIAFAGALLLGIYPVFFRWIPVLSPEAMGLFLMCGFMYFYTGVQHEPQYLRRNIIAAAIFMGFLILTKYIFGYVVLAMIISHLALFLFNRSSFNSRSIIIFSLSFMCAVPYLIYTYSLTGRGFYWGTNGGEQLYWMSSPHMNEVGSWHGKKMVLEDGIPGLKKDHIEFYRQVDSLTNVERDDEFKKKAIENIKRYPHMYIKNWIANIGRYVFGYPFSYRKQSLLPLAYIIPNMFVVVPLILALYPAYLGRRKIPLEIWALMLLFCFYSGAVSLIWAITRYLIPIVPIVFLWLFFVYTHVIQIRIK